MKHIQLKFIKTLNRYTTAKVEESDAITNINTYPVDHDLHKKEHKNKYITYERLIELQPSAINAGYLFVY